MNFAVKTEPIGGTYSRVVVGKNRAASSFMKIARRSEWAITHTATTFLFITINAKQQEHHLTAMLLLFIISPF